MVNPVYITFVNAKIDIDNKFNRYMALETPVLSVVEEHTWLLEDICNSYIAGNSYSALTGACCLGERIFNNIIFKVMDDFKVSPHYKNVYGKASLTNWAYGIRILYDWKIVDEETRKKFLRLKELRDESIHYQKKDQDLEQISLEAINVVNRLVKALFGLGPERKNVLIYFEVPGELFLKKDAENNPMAKAFYIPCAVLVGPKHRITSDETGRLVVSDANTYETKDISDAEFVKLRIEQRAG